MVIKDLHLLKKTTNRLTVIHKVSSEMVKEEAKEFERPLLGNIFYIMSSIIDLILNNIGNLRKI